MVRSDGDHMLGSLPPTEWCSATQNSTMPEPDNWTREIYYKYLYLTDPRFFDRYMVSSFTLDHPEKEGGADVKAVGWTPASTLMVVSLS